MIYLYILFGLALILAILSFVMYHHKFNNSVRALGILLAYVSGAIALKIFFMLYPPH